MYQVLLETVNKAHKVLSIGSLLVIQRRNRCGVEGAALNQVKFQMTVSCSNKRPSRQLVDLNLCDSSKMSVLQVTFGCCQHVEMQNIENVDGYVGFSILSCI